MNITKILIVVLVTFFTVMSCKQEAKKETQENSAAVIEEHSKKLNNWFEAQFQEELAKSPMNQTYLGIKTDDYGKWDDISSKKEVEDLERAKKKLGYIKDSIDVSKLDKATLLSYKLMKLDLENEIEDFQYRLYDYPVNQMHGMQSEIPGFMINMHRIENKSDAEAYISRIEGMDELFSQLIENMKIRERNGILPPKFVFAKVLDDCRNIINGKPFDESNEESTLLADFKSKLETQELSDNEKKQLITNLKKALIENVKPAYDNLITLLEEQQLRATTDDGVWKFAKGEVFYNTALKRTTTTDMTAEQIHELGLKEVERIHSEMRDIMKQVKYDGTLQDFLKYMKEDKKFYYSNSEEDKAAYLKEAVELIDTMKSRIDELFITKPKADIVVKAVEPFREKSAGKAFYQRGTPDGSRPGIYYANLYDMEAMPKYQMEALAYHEGIPGHHMQLSIAQELQNIPKFRKYDEFYTAYIEGWGLYNEFLPKEIGMYSDPYSDFGRLAMELWRACRLVVDTGIHTKKWTREEGIKYYTDNTPNAESDAIKMVERHIVMPGQATAYKIGMNKILELREGAKEKLGSAFDIREFHDVVLTNGPVPLHILEELVAQWVAAKKVAL